MCELRVDVFFSLASETNVPHKKSDFGRVLHSFTVANGCKCKRLSVTEAAALAWMGCSVLLSFSLKIPLGPVQSAVFRLSAARVRDNNHFSSISPEIKGEKTLKYPAGGWSVGECCWHRRDCRCGLYALKARACWIHSGTADVLGHDSALCEALCIRPTVLSAGEHWAGVREERNMEEYRVPFEAARRGDWGYLRQAFKEI